MFNFQSTGFHIAMHAPHNPIIYLLPNHAPPGFKIPHLYTGTGIKQQYTPRASSVYAIPVLRQSQQKEYPHAPSETCSDSILYKANLDHYRVVKLSYQPKRNCMICHDQGAQHGVKQRYFEPNPTSCRKLLHLKELRATIRMQ